MCVSDRKLVLLVVLILVIIVVARLIFNQKYTTDADREAHHNQLVWGTLIAIGVTVLLIWGSCMKGGDEEYGFFGDLQKTWRDKNAQWKAKRDAKKEGKSLEEQRADVAAVKIAQRAKKNETIRREAEVAYNERMAKMKKPEME